uniref:creatine kinase n=1 Tax=Oncorhynchus mykiss TaxID=8022 RepID=A0A8C7WGS2_ONCMY
MPFGNTHNNFKLNFKVEEEYPDLTKHNNHMAKVLTKDMYTGVDNPGHRFIMTVGCVAGDEESYEIFKDLLDPIISDRHSGYKPTDKHKTDLNFENLKVVRVCTGRSIKEYTLPPHNSRGERRAVEKLSVEVLNTLDGEFKGKYYPLNKMTDAEQEQLIADHFLFDKPVSPLLGIWYSFFVWMNEDHLRVISVEKGGNMKEVFRCFCVGLRRVCTGTQTILTWHKNTPNTMEAQGHNYKNINLARICIFLVPFERKHFEVCGNVN